MTKSPRDVCTVARYFFPVSIELGGGVLRLAIGDAPSLPDGLSSAESQQPREAQREHCAHAQRGRYAGGGGDAPAHKRPEEEPERERARVDAENSALHRVRG